MKSPLRKNLGEKNCEFTDEIRRQIVDVYMNFEDSDVSRIFNNSDFGYWLITVERPLRLRIDTQKPIPDALLRAEELKTYRTAISSLPKGTPTDDWSAFAKATKLKAALLKKVRPFITEKDSTAKPVEGEADTDLRDTEIVPFSYDGGILAFMENEVHPFAPDAWFEEKQTKIGYEVSFTKYFYRPVELRSIAEILEDLKILEAETDGILAEIIGGVQG